MDELPKKRRRCQDIGRNLESEVNVEISVREFGEDEFLRDV